jgi:nucleotide-binding universal stress UspA family protein
MTEWKRICCAVDFSEPSRIALLKASELARRFEGELLLLHVVQRVAFGGDVVVAAQEPAGLPPEEIEGTLALWRTEAERVSGRPARWALLSGDPAAEIVRFAREWSCDVLVVGTHGRKGLSRFVVGSVAGKVVRAAPCAVLVARRAQQAAARAAESAARGTQVSG